MDVLIVEDDPLLLSLWSTVFGEAGHNTVLASTAAEARRSLMMSKFDLMLVDLHLGSDSGLSVTTAAAYSNPDCRMIIVTGSSMFPHGELFQLAPTVSAVLRKPVMIDDLLAISEYDGADAAEEEPAPLAACG